MSKTYSEEKDRPDEFLDPDSWTMFHLMQNTLSDLTSLNVMGIWLVQDDFALLFDEEHMAVDRDNSEVVQDS